MKKIVSSILIVVVVLILAVAGYVKFFLPKVDAAPDLKVIATPQRIAHGEYLANHVTVCIDCHSTRNWNKFSGPILKNTLGKGGEYFGKEVGMPGKIYSKNITPYHLKDWTDGEIFRTITTGVNKKGEALFPIMPYPYYGKMDKEDILDIIAYIRSLAPLTSEQPSHELDFPMNFIINTIPKNAQLVTKPPKTDRVKYGGYLVNAAGCAECHTPVKKGQIIPELIFSGGREFQFPYGVTLSANITSDKETGIGNWSEADFIERFKAYEDANHLNDVKPSDSNTPMPWYMYAGMDSSDLSAIYHYLQTTKPIGHKVNHFTMKGKKE
ncbi:MAG: cytochrome C [Niastella sp. SCN 39-18]|nr:c-type cytochrome [Sphingobacteriales bacterium]ODT51828.1 MAG: cytochrome C [Niastella sp. SCN 39-18]OJW10079.1 MAG: cytochrome C [Sphingobacteriales bacterium 39-19]